MWFHVGANVDQREQVFINTMTAAGLGLRAIGATAAIEIKTLADANRAIKNVDQSLMVVNKQRADLGAYQNRLEHTIMGTDSGAENLQSAESHIRDTDMAQEMTGYVRNQILNQTEIAMLAQANQSNANVLQILR
jgi:flagellin